MCGEKGENGEDISWLTFTCARGDNARSALD